MIVIRLFMPLTFMLQLAAAAPGLFMPLAFMFQVQIRMQPTMLTVQLDIILVIVRTYKKNAKFDT